jgi:chemotaxis receptor (MCP) glutamine deamidase CheD
MDPITSAILAALPALATAVVSSSVKDAYAGLKAVIARSFGATSAVAKSVEDLEAHPKSKGQATVLSERIAETNAAADSEIMRAVDKLVEALAKTAASNVHIDAKMTGGVAGIVGAQNVSIGSLNVGGGKPSKG